MPGLRLEVNLLPPEVLERRRPNPRRLLWAAGGVIALFLLAFLAVLLWADLGTVESTIASERQVIRSLEPEVRTAEHLRMRLAVLTPLPSLRPTAVGANAEQILLFVPRGVLVEGILLNAGVLTVSGQATHLGNLEQFLRALAGLPPLADFELERVARSGAGYRFTLSGQLGTAP